MQFPYNNRMVNLLDTPGHEDFSEDTYRTLTAVDSCLMVIDSCLMVIDAAKGVEDRTIKLMNVCRLRDTPIISFVNKLDRDIRDPIESLDEMESVLGIAAAPINWPLGAGKEFKGVYNLYTDTIHVYTQQGGSIKRIRTELRRRLHENPHKTGRWLKSVVQSHINYYGVPFNSRALSLFVEEVKKSWLKSLRRRSQRHRLNWDRFGPVVRYRIPSPRIVHLHPNQRFYVKT